jgi:release factor glutamine methyltransferase
LCHLHRKITFCKRTRRYLEALQDFSCLSRLSWFYYPAMTVLEVIQRSSEFLSRKGVDSPRLQAELLLAEVLGVKRLKLYLDFERVLADAEVEKMRELVKRRGQREPLQQILGSTSFCGFEMKVTRDVLVPRPETELLAERGWEFLKGVVAARGEEAAKRPPQAFDFGTGSGCIAIALALKCPEAFVFAVDKSEAALLVAGENAVAHGVTDRVQLMVGDGFEVATGLKFDLIVSNPPYIPAAEIAKLQPEVRDFEPLLALSGGADGLDVIRRIAKEAISFLAPEGRLMMEFSDGQGAAAAKVFEREGWVVDEIVKDLTKRERILIAHRAVS